MQTQVRPRYENIDALRGLAALLVISRHSVDLMCSLPAALHTGAMLCKVSQGMDLGRVGVVAFFAISGFVIYPTIRGRAWHGTRAFLIRRFFRIYPAYWLSLAIGYAVLWQALDRSLTPLQLAASATMLSSLFGVPYVMGQYWTLEVELVFYGLIIALFLLSVIRSPLTLFAMVAGCIGLQVLMALHVALPHVDPQWGVVGVNLATMFWGGLFRQWHDAPAARVAAGGYTMRVTTLLVVATSMIALPLVAVLVRHRHPEAMPAIAGHLVGIALFAATVLLVRRVPRPAAWLGVISYSVYLLHPVVMYPLWLAARDDGLARLGIAPLMLLTMACAVAAAAVSYYAVEKPAIALGRRLTRD